ncbi:MAG: STAS domain-containing protein [Leptospirillia bacterium]
MEASEKAMELLSDEGGKLSAPPDLGIQRVEALKKDLLEALGDARDQVVMSLKDVSRMDTAAVQVLLAAKKSADGLGRGFVLEDPSEACSELTKQLGLFSVLFES